MAATIRLVRKGKKNRPFFRIVVVSKEKDGHGNVIESLGWYDPLKKSEEYFSVNQERVLYWLGVGAQPSQTVKEHLTRNGIIPKGE
ncbi:MAG: 30S ribosomal protein S16 [Candidatus Ratteibacteria bacterium]